MQALQMSEPEMIHPFRAWLILKEMSYADIAKMCKAAGMGTSKNYIYQIASGRRRPKWPLACFLANLTGGVVTPAQFMEFPVS